MNVKIEFDNLKNNDLFLFVAENGRGKTNLVNSINWCLYGDEPSLKKDEEFPVVNKSIVLNSKKNSIHLVQVDVWIEDDSGTPTIFHRSQKFKLLMTKDEIEERKGRKQQLKPEEIAIPLAEAEFSVTIKDDDGNSKICYDDDAKALVDQFIPKNIREFFLFDGERLDRYFKEATGANIQNATFNISQIERLRRVIDHTGDILKELRDKEASSIPSLKDVDEDIKNKEVEIKKLEEELIKCVGDIEIADKRIKEIVQVLDGYPDAGKLERVREDLSSKKTDLLNTIARINENKKNIIYDVSKIIFLKEPLDFALSAINEKREKNELPPSIDVDILKEILTKGTCSICTHKLDDESEKKIKELILKIGKSSDVGKILMDIEPHLKTFTLQESGLLRNLESISHALSDRESELLTTEQDIVKIDNELMGHPIEKIKNLQSERTALEKSRDYNNTTKGMLKERIKNAKNDLEGFKRERDAEIKKVGAHLEISNQRKFAERAVDIASKIELKLMQEVRSELERETNNNFFKLISKKETFDRVEIDEMYSLHVIDKTLGVDCTGALSAGERALLALSFTMAIHNVSGFQGPLVIDTPVKSIDKNHRDEIAKALLNISKRKQIILLFVDTEYENELQNNLESIASGLFVYKLGTDEMESNIIRKR